MTTFFEHLSAYKVAKTANISQFNQQCYSKCSKYPPSAFTQARRCRHFLKFTINLQIASCGKIYAVCVKLRPH